MNEEVRGSKRGITNFVIPRCERKRFLRLFKHPAVLTKSENGGLIKSSELLAWLLCLCLLQHFIINNIESSKIFLHLHLFIILFGFGRKQNISRSGSWKNRLIFC